MGTRHPISIGDFSTFIFNFDNFSAKQISDDRQIHIQRRRITVESCLLLTSNDLVYRSPEMCTILMGYAFTNLPLPSLPTGARVILVRWFGRSFPFCSLVKLSSEQTSDVSQFIILKFLLSDTIPESLTSILFL